MTAARSALSEVPRRHAEYAVFAAHLSNILQARWSRFGTDADLAEATELARQAMLATPADSVTMAARLVNLAELLLAGALDRTSDEDLALAVDLVNTAASMPDTPRSERAAVLSGAGNALTVAFTHDQSPSTIGAALRSHRRALAASGPAQRPAIVGRLAAAWAQRWFVDRDPTTLRRAVVVARRAVDAAAAGSATHAVHLLGLATLLRDRSARRGRRADWASARRMAQEAGQIAAASVTVRMNAGVLDGELSMRDGEPREAAAAYGRAVALLGRAAWHGTDRRTRQAHLRRWDGLSRDGAGAAIAAGSADTALTMLEGGRAVLWSQRLQLRTRDHRLVASARALAARLDELRTALDDEQW